MCLSVQEEEVKCVNPVSPSKSSRSSRSLFGSQDGEQLLLPEFEDLLSSDGVLSTMGDGPMHKDTDAKKSRKSQDVHMESSVDKSPETPRSKKKGSRVGSLVEEWSSRVSQGGTLNASNVDRMEQAHSVHLSQDQEAERLAADFFPAEPDTSFTDYVDSLADEVAELGQLRALVHELQEKEVKLEAELLEYYGLREREEDLENELRLKSAQITRLNAEINTMQDQGADLQARITFLEAQQLEYKSKIAGLQAQDTTRGDTMGSLKKQLEEFKTLNKELKFQATDLSARLAAMQAQEVKYRLKIASLQAQDQSQDAEKVESLTKQLEEARQQNVELQRQVHSDTGQAKAQLLMLKQKVASLETKGLDRVKQDLDTERKLQSLKELEVEVVELRRTSKELQHEKRGMTVRLAAAEAQIQELSKMTEVRASPLAFCLEIE